MTVDAAETVGNLTIGTGATLGIVSDQTGNGSLTVFGTADIGGQVKVDSTSSDPTLTNHGAVTVESSGTMLALGSAAAINFVGDSVDNFGAIGADQGAVLFQGATLTNEPGATIGVANFGSMLFQNSVVNNGAQIGADTGGSITFEGSVVINAAQIGADTGGSITFAESSVINPGTIAAGAGGLVNIDNGTVENIGGTISAFGAASLVQLSDATIVGGVLSTGPVLSGGGDTIAVVAGTGVNMSVLDGSSSPVTIEGYVGVAPGAQLELAGTIHIDSADGRIDVGGPSGSTTPANLLIEGQVTLDTDSSDSGNSQITLEGTDSGPALIIGASGGTADTLDNVNAKISGSFQIGQGDGLLSLTNEAGGTIMGAVTVDTGNGVTNAGMMVAQTGVTLTIDDSVINTGTIEANGGTVVANGAITGTGSAIITAGGTFEIGSSDLPGGYFLGRRHAEARSFDRFHRRDLRARSWRRHRYCEHDS